jgi:hypothetical protein
MPVSGANTPKTGPGGGDGAVFDGATSDASASASSDNDSIIFNSNVRRPHVRIRADSGVGEGDNNNGGAANDTGNTTTPANTPGGISATQRSLAGHVFQRTETIDEAIDEEDDIDDYDRLFIGGPDAIPDHF